MDALLRGKRELGHELRMDLLKMGGCALGRVGPGGGRYHDAVQRIVSRAAHPGSGHHATSGAAASLAVRLGRPHRVSTVLRIEV